MACVTTCTKSLVVLCAVGSSGHDTIVTSAHVRNANVIGHGAAQVTTCTELLVVRRTVFTSGGDTVSARTDIHYRGGLQKCHESGQKCPKMSFFDPKITSNGTFDLKTGVFTENERFYPKTEVFCP